MNQPDSPFAKLEVDAAIRLRWALRDIRAKRLKMSPVSAEDLRSLVEMGLVEMKNDEPIVTNAGLDVFS